MLSKIFYDLFVFLYPLAAKLISPWNSKAKRWVDGRKNIFETIASQYKAGANNVWVHCSSLGEFEQARPLMEALKANDPSINLTLSFFSPSGYAVQKNYATANYVFFLPMDSEANAKKWLSLIQPNLVLFIKYEFWNAYLQNVKAQKIPLVLVSGIFRKDQPFFHWYGGFHKKMLACFTHFFVQSEANAQLLRSIGFNNVSVGGDTRFDRVIAIKNKFEPIALVEQFVGSNPTIVAGSTWTEDDEELDHYANTHPNIQFIIAPHDIDEERIQECLQLYKQSVLYSELAKDASKANGKNVLIVDNIGMLSKLYHYATIAYVGGGFTADGVHNVLEAAVYAKPVIHGPTFEKYDEATGLVACGGAFDFDDVLDLEALLDELLSDQEKYAAAAKAAGEFVHTQKGATQKIVTYLKKGLKN
jgi:3-deoxy-D-manno-octulosonic-acid transferase